jgi:hypothetical protein
MKDTLVKEFYEKERFLYGGVHPFDELSKEQIKDIESGLNFKLYKLDFLWSELKSEILKQFRVIEFMDWLESKLTRGIK